MGQPDRKWLAKRLDNISRGLLVLHLLLTILYFDSQINLVIAVNLACIVAGYAALRLLRQGQYRTHMLILYLSELVQLVVSAFWVGWSAGLQLPLVGLTLLAFLGEYLGRSLSVPYLPALPLSIVNCVVYLAVFPFRFHTPGPLRISPTAVLAAQLLWSVLVLVCIVVGMVTAMQLTTDSERALANKAQTDRLTGLYNRAGYDRLLNDADLASTTLVLVDTDKFKGINDRFGHETGDRVLQKIARSLSQNFRRGDRVCRIGGDEFAILMSDNDILQDDLLVEKVNRINQELAHTTDDHLPYVSVSVGAAHGGDAQDWTELFKQADQVLYQVKKEGGRACQLYHPT